MISASLKGSPEGDTIQDPRGSQVRILLDDAKSSVAQLGRAPHSEKSERASRFRAHRTQAISLRLGASRRMAVVPLLITAILLSSCATVGGGRSEVVKAEDVKVNSLNVWTAAMEFHVKHSKEESQSVYRVLEAARTDFPPAWAALNVAIKTYKRTGEKEPLDRALAVISAIMASIDQTGVLK